MTRGSLTRTVRSRLSAHPLAVDTLVALAVGIFSAGGDVFADHAPGRVWFFDIALAVPLLARRRWPAGVFLAVAAIALVQWIVGRPVNGDLAVLVALYTVGAHERRRWTVGAAAVIAEIGVVLAAARWAPPGTTLRALILLTGTATAAWVIGIYVRTRRAYLTSVLERASTAERERDQQAQIAVAAERARIAREMHDVVAHSLSVMIALTDGAAATVPTASQEAREVLGQASTVGRQALGEMHRLLGVLRDGEAAELAPQPGTADLDDLVAGVRSAGLAVELVVSGEPGSSPPGAQLAVHRIVRESLTNVLKHAPGASRVTVRLDYGPAEIGVEILNDDGRPPTRSRASSTGHGLTGMRERAAVYGGSVQAGQPPQGGWRVATRLHLTDPDARR